jgi:nucleotide-binding universal stress UspA family protein
MRDDVILVGFDGSEGGRRALRWAVSEATLRGCGVQVVTTWPLPTAGQGRSGDDEQADVKTMQGDAIRAAVGAMERPPAVSQEIVHGEPIDVLTRLSARSSLLVLGSHGISGLRHSGLGSVADACARLASCPVVVVPPAAAAGGQSEELVAG